MTSALIVHRSGPGVTVQDLGRTGYLAQGLSRGGVTDRLAQSEGAALLGQSPDLAALEIVGSPLEVEVSSPTWIALTGAPTHARRGDGELAWNACHELRPGERLSLGSVREGNYAYLHVAGGIDTPRRAGGRGTHLTAGLGAPVESGTRLPIGADPQVNRAAGYLTGADRFRGGRIRMVNGPQTHMFASETLERFLSTGFIRTAWSNRQGVKLGFDGDGFRPDDGLNIVSEVVVPGDIQITGDGTPYVLGVECQTIGGYPRIGTVVPQDLSRVMQATPGSILEFQMVTLEEALSDHFLPEAMTRTLRKHVRDLVRDPHHIPDLLSYNLISGATAGRELSAEEGTS